MQFRYDHGVSKDQAIQGFKNFRPALMAKFGDQVSDLQESWAGHTLSMSFKARGQKVTGTLMVDDGWLLVDAKLPFEGYSYFRAQAKEYLLKAQIQPKMNGETHIVSKPIMGGGNGPPIWNPRRISPSPRSTK